MLNLDPGAVVRHTSVVTKDWVVIGPDPTDDAIVVLMPVDPENGTCAGQPGRYAVEALQQNGEYINVVAS